MCFVFKNETSSQRPRRLIMPRDKVKDLVKRSNVLTFLPLCVIIAVFRLIINGSAF